MFGEKNPNRPTYRPAKPKANSSRVGRRARRRSTRRDTTRSSGTAHRAHRPIGGGGAATLPFSSTRFRLLGRVSRRLSVCFGRGSGWGDNEKRKFGWGGWCRGYRRVDAVGEETERRRATRIARPADGMWGLWPVGARLGPGPLRRCRRRSERRRGPVAVTTSRRGPRRDMWVMPTWY